MALRSFSPRTSRKVTSRNHRDLATVRKHSRLRCVCWSDPSADSLRSFHSKEPRPAFRGASDGARQSKLGHVMCKDTVDAVQLSIGQRILKLDHSHVVGYSRVELLPC